MPAVFSVSDLHIGYGEEEVCIGDTTDDCPCLEEGDGLGRRIQHLGLTRSAEGSEDPHGYSPYYSYTCSRSYTRHHNVSVRLKTISMAS